MKKRALIFVFFVLTIAIVSFLWFYLKKPTVILKDDLVAEINSEHKIFDYVEGVNNGLITSSNKKIDTSTLGNKRLILKTKNVLGKEFDYKFKIVVKDTTAPVITCNKELSTTEGASIDLLSGVGVSDNSNESIEVKVEGDYDFNVAGSYNLKYVAEDSSHNVASEDFVLNVSKKAVVINTVSFADTTVEAGFPYYIKINRKLNVVYVYGVSGNKYSQLVKVFTCSTGRDTPLGVYKTLNKYEWKLLIGPCYGQYATRITGQILFHSVPYYSQSKDSLEYYLYNRLGRKDSLGCVRLTVADAKWIYDNCPLGTKVEIYDSDDLGGVEKPSTIHIDDNDPRRGWDPTDPDPNNPWKAN